jgi:hypothetical protein
MRFRGHDGTRPGVSNVRFAPAVPSAFHRVLEPLDRRMMARAVAAHRGDIARAHPNPTEEPMTTVRFVELLEKLVLPTTRFLSGRLGHGRPELSGARFII